MSPQLPPIRRPELLRGGWVPAKLSRMNTYEKKGGGGTPSELSNSRCKRSFRYLSSPQSLAYTFHKPHSLESPKPLSLHTLPHSCQINRGWRSSVMPNFSVSHSSTIDRCS